MFVCVNLVNGQEGKNFLEKDSTMNNQRVKLAAIGSGAAYISSMSGLYVLWYKDYPSMHFHSFNDANEWQQMDKIGHTGSAYYLSRWSNDIFEWTGMPEKKSAWLGAGAGFIYQATIEIFDGFSSQWGFSFSDVGANTLGAGLFLSQQLLHGGQLMQIKFSFHQTDYAAYRPNVLGKNLTENIFKDYNGQTYWLSLNISEILNSSNLFPSWLDVSVGYGAEGMTGANENPESIDGKSLPAFERYRKFYLSPDIDLSKIKTRSSFLKTAFEAFGFIKFPLPALEYNSKGKFSLHGIYF